jgi:hypothetical protein
MAEDPTGVSGQGRRYICVVSVRVVIVTAVLALTLSPATAGASSQDVTSTHAYLAATYRALHATVATWSSVEASIRGLERKLNSECPDVGAGSPQNEEEQKFVYVVAGALWATAYRTDAAIIRPYVHTLNRLTWSNPQITRDARRLARGLQEMVTLQVPDICADVRSWRVSGYGQVAANVTSYDQHVEAIEIPEIPRHLLNPYVPSADRSLRAQTEHLATRYKELEFVQGQTDWLALLKTVGLNG